jgi:ankyrin repeat protein
MLVTVLSTALIACLFLYWFVGSEGSKNKTYAIITALQQRDKARVRALAAQPKYRDSVTADGDTPLHFIARLNAVDMAEILIEAGAEVNVANNHGYTPLLIASERGYKRMVRLLLQAGAETHRTTKSGKSALDLATQKDHKEVLYLLDHNAMMNRVLLAS